MGPLLEQIRLAEQLAEETLRTSTHSDPHQALILSAITSSHLDLLQQICLLTDDEADGVEPAFTRFEKLLLELEPPSSSLSVKSPTPHHPR